LNAANLLARRYALALQELAAEQGKLEVVFAELQELQRLVAQSPALYAALRNPHIPAQKRGDALQKAFADRFCDLTLHFLQLLVRKRRTAYLDQIISAYREYADAAEGIISAQVRTAAPLSAEETEKLRLQLSKLAGKQVRMELSIDPVVIGGVAARMGGILVDGSVAGNLSRLQDALMKNNVRSQE